MLLVFWHYHKVFSFLFAFLQLQPRFTYLPLSWFVLDDVVSYIESIESFFSLQVLFIYLVFFFLKTR
ncbi:hypothetical protein BD560DRAFT_398318 [Blakeslea trispora]|nr:hypothetical protein BD560DRAFT_398318 [Blakeslea trispora]